MTSSDEDYDTDAFLHDECDRSQASDTLGRQPSLVGSQDDCSDDLPPISQVNSLDTCEGWNFDNVIALRQECEDLENEVAKRDQKFEHHNLTWKTKDEDLRNEISRHEYQYAHVLDQNEAWEKTVTQLRRSLYKKELEVSAEVNISENLHAELLKNRSELLEVRQVNQDLREKFACDLEDYKQRISRLSQSLETNQQTMFDTNRTNAKLQTQVANAQRSNMEAFEKLEEYSTIIEQQHDQVTDLTTERDHLLNKLEEFEEMKESVKEFARLARRVKNNHIAWQQEEEEMLGFGHLYQGIARPTLESPFHSTGRRNSVAAPASIGWAVGYGSIEESQTVFRRQAAATSLSRAPSDDAISPLQIQDTRHVSLLPFDNAATVPDRALVEHPGMSLLAELQALGDGALFDDAPLSPELIMIDTGIQVEPPLISPSTPKRQMMTLSVPPDSGYGSMVSQSRSELAARAIHTSPNFVAFEGARLISPYTPETSIMTQSIPPDSGYGSMMSKSCAELAERATQTSPTFDVFKGALLRSDAGTMTDAITQSDIPVLSFSSPQRQIVLTPREPDNDYYVSWKDNSTEIVSAAVQTSPRSDTFDAALPKFVEGTMTDTPTQSNVAELSFSTPKRQIANTPREPDSGYGSHRRLSHPRTIATAVQTSPKSDTLDARLLKLGPKPMKDASTQSDLPELNPSREIMPNSISSSPTSSVQTSRSRYRPSPLKIRKMPIAIRRQGSSPSRPPPQLHLSSTVDKSTSTGTILSASNLEPELKHHLKGFRGHRYAWEPQFRSPRFVEDLSASVPLQAIETEARATTSALDGHVVTAVEEAEEIALIETPAVAATDIVQATQGGVQATSIPGVLPYQIRAFYDFFKSSRATEVPVQRNQDVNPLRSTVPIEVHNGTPAAVKGVNQPALQNLTVDLTSATEKTASEKLAEQQRNAAIAAQNMLPVWHTQSTVTGNLPIHPQAGTRIDGDSSSVPKLDMVEEDKKQGITLTTDENDELAAYYTRMAQEKEEEERQDREDEASSAGDDEDEEAEDEFEDVGIFPAACVSQSSLKVDGAGTVKPRPGGTSPAKELVSGNESSAPVSVMTTPTAAPDDHLPGGKRVKLEGINGNEDLPGIQAISDEDEDADFEDAL